MHKALVGVTVLLRGEPLHLQEGELVDLGGLEPGEIAFLIAAEYVEPVRGEKEKPETPEGKRKKPESR